MVMLTDLAVACRKSGLKVIELPGWTNRGRPGAFNPRGVVIHHVGSTAGGYGVANGILRNGRPGLPGPLCQIGLGRQGEVYVIAASRSNHAGKSRTSGFMRAGDGNSQSIGIEAFLSGSEPWPGPMEDAYHRLCAALCDHYRWPRSHVRSHAETSTSGKWDPGVNGKHINMTAFRRSVAAINLGSTATQEDDMSAAAEKKIDEIHASVRQGQSGRFHHGAMFAAVRDLQNTTRSNGAQIAALTAAVNALSDKAGVDAKTVQAAVTKAVGDFRLTLGPVDNEGDGA